jgi:hypothetical protein
VRARRSTAREPRPRRGRSKQWSGEEGGGRNNGAGELDGGAVPAPSLERSLARGAFRSRPPLALRANRAHTASVRCDGATAEGGAARGTTHGWCGWNSQGHGRMSAQIVRMVRGRD